jgi:hypothetical protein
MFSVVKKLLLVAISHLPALLLVAFVLYSRLVGNNWDAGHHLHPDERFLTMVQLALQVPTTWAEYLDPQQSTINPYNQEYGFFVYGILPLMLNKLIAVFAQTDTYALATLQGRFLSGLADSGTVLVLYQLTQALFHNHKKRRLIALFSSASYALAVLPIQLAHFFAVDSFLTLCLTMTLLQHVRLTQSPSPKRFVASAVFFSLALACKINALLIAPLIGSMLLFALWRSLFTKHLVVSILKIIGSVLLYTTIVLLVLRFASPHYFASATLLNPMPNPQFISNLQSLKNYEGPDVWYPPAIQWLSKPMIWFSVKNIVLYGYGIGLSLLALIGLATLIPVVRKPRLFRQQWLLYGIIGWGLAISLYQSTQFVQAIRYFIIVYPVFAILSGLGWLWLSQLSHKKLYFISFNIILVCILLIWPLAFLGVYHQRHSRVVATEWIHQSLPSYSLIGNEYWDDPLPLGLPGSTKQFIGENLHVFEQDTFTKWRVLTAQLNQLDYYVLSSNRAWGSISAVPHKYPRMSAFYQDLLAGNTDYELVAQFTNYPSLRYLGIPIDFSTDHADESFTVYDHPKVMIYMNKNTKRPPELTGYERTIIK